ncbi:TPA: agmatinase [Klebsiella pneumoniae]|uniref:agmatinase n=1 Tax=Klebsiella pneumoniae TaxID=573 RepID=UPI000A3CE0BA|nr:agmatinase [Klebsiella pneumoniae]ELY5842822.1 agmatinase [Cronobacter sakazakii]HDT2354231.1 agmatinase [Klebsiella pneumoniae subsp. pneumoniae]AYK01961.1 agmatinase [Klebsiella pneumoniae]MCC4954966.1 agmatinase [Klebsiella pneumoniae]MCC4959961.1 agmatinase [Klebsiella pneumoniae]
MNNMKLAQLRERFGNHIEEGTIYNPDFANAAKVPAASRAEGHSKWPLADPATFLNCAYDAEAYGNKFADLDVALIGVPMDLGAGDRPGCRFGPQAVRSVSRVGPYDRLFNIAPAGELRVKDVGDVAFTNSRSLEQCHADIEAYFLRIAESGVTPLSVGGDHSMTYSILRALGKDRPLALVHFDAHSDTSGSYGGTKYGHGSPFRQAVLDGVLNPEKCVQIGIRGGGAYHSEFALESGMTVIFIEDIIERGIDYAIEKIHDVIGDSEVYITFDIDSVDPGYAPGTGTPEVGGMTPREVFQVLHAMAGMNVIGGDVVEVAPQYDATSNTAQITAQVQFLQLCLIALAKRHK